MHGWSRTLGLDVDMKRDHPTWTGKYLCKNYKDTFLRWCIRWCMHSHLIILKIHLIAMAIVINQIFKLSANLSSMQTWCQSLDESLISDNFVKNKHQSWLLFPSLNKYKVDIVILGHTLCGEAGSKAVMKMNVSLFPYRSFLCDNPCHIQ